MSANSEPSVALVTLETAIGWFALLASGSAVRQLTLGHATEAAALAALDPTVLEIAQRDAWRPDVIERLGAYASGRPVDFQDVPIDDTHLSEFQRSVVQACRAIGHGQTSTYGALASQAGRPGAARAVGNCLARNRTPLVVPCHRVITARGGLGGFSAPGGLALKEKLLRLEAGLPIG